MPSSTSTDGFRERLEVLLSRYGVSKAQMAHESGLPSRAVETYFKGHAPGAEALISLSRGLAGDIQWLIGEKDHKSSILTDNVGEASWRVAKDFLEEFVKAEEMKASPIAGGKVLGKEPGQLAATIEARIVARFVALRESYAAPSLDAARDAWHTRNVPNSEHRQGRALCANLRTTGAVCSGLSLDNSQRDR